jgi:hypothetical protein
MNENEERLLNEGDNVTHRYHGKISSIQKVKRVTATLAELGNGNKVRRKVRHDGELVEFGGEKWSFNSYNLTNENDYHQVKLTSARKKVVAKLEALIKSVGSGSLDYVEGVATMFIPNPLLPESKNSHD